MRDIWEGTHGLREACDNTLLIAERCDITFNENANFMPRFPVPEGESEDTWLVKEVDRGLLARYPGGVPDDVRARADFETGVILSMGFPGYFLVVADFINWAKEHGIRVGPGPRLGHGSIVAYAMRITDLDPLVHGLIFERFLNPDRVSMPDFDIDFDERRRGEVIRYVTEKYGDDRVAQIVTYGTIKAKQAVKDSSRVLGYPFAMGDRITKAMPPAIMGKDVPLSKIFDPTDKRYGEGGEFRALYESDADVRKVVDTAKGLEGLKRQWGVHAAGVIMSSEPLLDVIPIMRREQDGAIITQFDYPTCEQLGLIKMDFLGLRNLTGPRRRAHQHRPQPRRVVRRWRSWRWTTRPPTTCWPRGRRSGVFQLDGVPMRRLLRLLKPDSFEDIAASWRSTGQARWAPTATPTTPAQERQAGDHPHPPRARRAAGGDPGAHLRLIVYQEQVMAIPQKLAGYSLGKADLLRRADGQEEEGRARRAVRGLPRRHARQRLLRRRGQGAVGHSGPVLRLRFNKSHTAAYGLISYWTAYLKAHYPAEYMAALLTSVGTARTGWPSTSASAAGWASACCRPTSTTPPATSPPWARTSASGCTRSATWAPTSSPASWRRGRRRASSPTSPTSWTRCRRSSARRRSWSPRQGGCVRLPRARPARARRDPRGRGRPARRHQAQRGDRPGLAVRRPGRRRLRLDDRAGPRHPEWDKQTLLGFEREMLGLYVSSHPLMGLEHVLSASADCTIGCLLADESAADNTPSRSAG
jgi:DNA polymerase-3 subunit alpha